MYKPLQKSVFFVGIILLCCSFSFAQTYKKYNYSVELGGFYSTNNRIPFWLKNNQFGAFPATGNTVMFRQALESKADTSKRFFKSNYCADIVLVVGNQAQILIPELYYKADLGKFSIMLGRKKQIHGLVDSTLSSGSITWSGNSLPIPEVQISIPKYQRLFFDRLAIKGHYTHGWFGDQASVKNFYLHQKSLYGRIGKPNAKLKLYGGILHNAQWGGKPKYGIPDTDPRYVKESFAANWYVYRNIVLPVANTGDDSTSGYSAYDYENRFGNHIGQLDMGGEWSFKTSKLLFYKQIIFETGQTFSSLTNIDDGLYGLSFTNFKTGSKINKAVLEVLQTTNQGIYRAGLLRTIGFYGKHFGRNQNYYFNHGQYLDGWSYNGLSLGTPFMIPDGQIRIEKNNPTNQFFSNNNRIKAIYLGLNTQLNSINVESKFSYSRNYGSPRVDIGVADQLSVSFKAQVPAPKLYGFINVGIGIEQGDLIQDNYGVFLSFKRIWK
jgi:Capsule assembly protein Wzi